MTTEVETLVTEQAGGEGEPSTDQSQADLAALREALAQREARMAELEAQLAGASAAAAQLQAQVSALQQALASTVDRYRALLLSSNPDVPEELVRGDTVQELDASLARARELVQRIAARLEARLSRQRVPAGAPPRSTPDPSALTPREKIAYALSRR